jgi:broad specificity phosphatase PhoE
MNDPHPERRAASPTGGRRRTGEPEGEAEGELASLVFVRHGQSAANVAFARAKAEGRADAGVPGPDAAVDLSPLGEQQAAALGRLLAGTDHRPDSVVSSPYVRALRTYEIARAVAADGGADLPPPEIDHRLGDRLMG